MSLLLKMSDGLGPEHLHKLELHDVVQVHTMEGSCLSGEVIGVCEEALVLGWTDDDEVQLTAWVGEDAIASVVIVRQKKGGGREDAAELPIKFDRKPRGSNGKV